MGEAPFSISDDAGAGASLIRDAKVMDFLVKAAKAGDNDGVGKGQERRKKNAVERRSRTQPRAIGIVPPS